MNETLIAERIEVSPDMINGDVNDYFALKVKGDSYHPLYMDGDTVLVCRDLSKPNPGNVYAVQIEGRTELRRIESIVEENRVCLCGLAMHVPPLYLTPEEYRVLGFPVILLRKIS